jgi:hypothetical protein
MQACCCLCAACFLFLAILTCAPTWAAWSCHLAVALHHHHHHLSATTAALPEDFGKLASLHRLGLKSNQLAELPSSFTGLTSLVELFITDNALLGFPQGMGNMRSLVKLQASFNKLREVRGRDCCGHVHVACSWGTAKVCLRLHATTACSPSTSCKRWGSAQVLRILVHSAVRLEAEHTICTLQPLSHCSNGLSSWKGWLAHTCGSHFLSHALQLPPQCCT